MHRCRPELLAAFKKRKALVGGCWRLDETYIKVNGQQGYLYRSVDQRLDVIDFLLTARGGYNATRRFLQKPSADGCRASPASTKVPPTWRHRGLRRRHDDGPAIKIRRCKYLNNIVEQDYRYIKRRTRPMPDLRSFWTARVALGQARATNDHAQHRRDWREHRTGEGLS